jgi:hypothetical protein
VSAIWNAIKNRPVTTIGAAVTALVVAVTGIVNAVYPGAVPDAQVNAIVAALGVFWVALASIRALVTPVAQPTLPQGTTVTVQTPGDAPNTTATV